MRRPTLVAIAVLAVAAIGAGGWFAFHRPPVVRDPVKELKTRVREIAQTRDHVTLVLSGRLMAEIFPCG